MKKIPVVFCFDDNLKMPAGVCLFSLLKNAKPDTFYDIFILHDDKATFQSSGYLDQLYEKFPNFNLTYRSVGDAFQGAYEVRGITIAAYYRLLIPVIVPEYDKIFYFDVDIIFRDDLSDIYENTDLERWYVAGTSTPYSDIGEYISTVINMNVEDYICSGTLLLNSKMIRDHNLIPKFKDVAEKKMKYQDQDTINIVCQGNIKIMPPSFGIVGTISQILADPQQSHYDRKETNYAQKFGTIHYNGPKPWNDWCYNFDIWWEYYRNSIFFDQKFYFDFYNRKLVGYDALTLWKRVKILLRFFINGRK